MPRVGQRLADSNDNVRLKNGITFSWKRTATFRSSNREAPPARRPAWVSTWLKSTLDATTTMNAIVVTRCDVIDFSKLSCEVPRDVLNRLLV